MGLIGAVSNVFLVFRTLYDCLPIAVKLLILGTFGLFLLFGIFHTLKG